MELDEMDLRILEVIEEEGNDLNKVVSRIEDQFDLYTDVAMSVVFFVARNALGIEIYY